MGQKSGPVKEPVGQVVKEIRRTTRRQFSAEEKTRIVLTCLRGEDGIAEAVPATTECAIDGEILLRPLLGPVIN